MDIRNSIVRIRSGEERGTGFIVNNKYIVTCSHVIDDENEILCKIVDDKNEFQTNIDTKLIIKFENPEIDLAFLEVLTELPENTVSLHLHEPEHSKDNEFQTYGFPDINKLHGEITQGKIMDVSLRSDNGVHAIKLECANAVRPGFSGAPIFDLKLQKVIGIITKDIDNLRGSDCAYGISATEISRRLPDLQKKSFSTIEESFQTKDSVRQGMRTFLQRAEVRLSTMHRIASSFLGGAILLFILSIIVKDTVPHIIRSIINSVFFFPNANSNPYLIIGVTHWIDYLSYISIILAILISVGLLAWSLFLLFRNLIRFYFTTNPPGFSNNLAIPRFSLTALSIASDETDDNKHKIFNYQLEEDNINFILSKDKNKYQHIIDLYDNFKDEVVSKSRNKLESTIKERQYDKEKFKAFQVAFGLASVTDRELEFEVAKMELSMVRHSMILRRLVLRYLKAALLFVFTFIAYSIFDLIIFDRIIDYRQLMFLLIATAIYSILLPLVIRFPMKWILELSDKKSDEFVRFDNDLILFEHQVTFWSICIFIFSFSLFFYNFYYHLGFQQSISINPLTFIIIFLVIGFIVARYAVFKKYWETSIIREYLNLKKFIKTSRTS